MISQSLGGVALLLVFFLVFSVIAIWVYWPSHKQKLERHAHIPLKED